MYIKQNALDGVTTSHTLHKKKLAYLRHGNRNYAIWNKGWKKTKKKKFNSPSIVCREKLKQPNKCMTKFIKGGKENNKY